MAAKLKIEKRGDEILIAGTIPARFGLIWFSGFRGEDLNVIFYQNMPNLHNRYISAERKNAQKKTEFMLNYSQLSQLLLEEMILYLIYGFGMVSCTVSPLFRFTAHLFPVYSAT
jgi:hypothetical protein